MTKEIITAVSPLKSLRKSPGATTRPTADVSNARTVWQKDHDGLAAAARSP
jgi:hypothetical protein